MKHCTRAVPDKCVGHQHLKNPNWRDCGKSERVERKELNQRTTALDQERYEVACLRQDIIDEYEKKSGELLEYLNSVELAFDRQRLEYEDRKAQLLAENKELKNELEGGCRAHLQEHMAQQEEREKREWDTQRAMDHLKEEYRRSEKMLKKEQRRVEMVSACKLRRWAIVLWLGVIPHPKELEGELSNMQAELQRKDDLFYHKTKILERGKKKLEIENANLARKAALGWMVGCLSDLFLRLDPELGVRSVLKLVRKVQRELEYGNNVFDCHMGQGPKVEYDIIQKEIRRLLIHSPQRTPCCLLKDKPRRNDYSDIRRKRICKGRRHWRQHSVPEATLRAAAAKVGCEAALQRIEGKSPRSASAPESPRTSCPTQLMIDKAGESCSGSSCHTSSELSLQDQKSSQNTPPSWTPTEQYLLQMNRRQSLRKMLRHLDASMTFILGQERRRRKVEGRTSISKPTRRGVICCKHRVSTIL